MQLTITLSGPNENDSKSSFTTDVFNEGLASSLFKECINTITTKKMEFANSLSTSVSKAILEEEVKQLNTRVVSSVGSRSKRIVHYKCNHCNTERYEVTASDSVKCFVCSTEVLIDYDSLVPLKITCNCGEFTNRHVVRGSTTKISCRRCKRVIPIKYDILHNMYKEDFK